MTIIKPGGLPELQVFEGKCLHCKCEFSFERREAVPESTCRNEDYLKVECPTCKRSVWVQI